MPENQLEYPQSYNQEEVQEILQLALARKQETGELELSRIQLQEIAADLAIDPASLELAEQDWLHRKTLTQKRQDFNQYRIGKFKQKLIRFVIVNSFLIVLNLISAGSISWSLYIVLLWGLGLSLYAFRNLQTQGETYEQDFTSWLRKQEIKQSFQGIWQRIKQSWQS